MGNDLFLTLLLFFLSRNINSIKLFYIEIIRGNVISEEDLSKSVTSEGSGSSREREKAYLRKFSIQRYIVKKRCT